MPKPITSHSDQSPTTSSSRPVNRAISEKSKATRKPLGNCVASWLSVFNETDRGFGVCIPAGLNTISEIPPSIPTLMKNDSGSKAETPEEVAEHISRLMAEAEAMLVGPVSERVADKFSDLRERFEQLQSKAADVYGDARKKVAAGARATDETIRSHPYESLAIALGVGVLIGVLIRRSGR